MDIDDLVALSRGLLELARRGEWERVMVLQPQRHQALEAFFSGSCSGGVVAAPQAERVRHGIREILTLDRQIMTLLRRHRDELAGRLNGLRSGQQARRAYAAMDAAGR